MKKLNNPHDKFLKETLSRKENAVGFIQNYLPQEIVTMIDLDNIEIEKDSYITKNLQEYFTDLLYKVIIKGEEITSMYYLNIKVILISLSGYNCLNI